MEHVVKGDTTEEVLQYMDANIATRSAALLKHRGLIGDVVLSSEPAAGRIAGVVHDDHLGDGLGIGAHRGEGPVERVGRGRPAVDEQGDAGVFAHWFTLTRSRVRTGSSGCRLR